MGKTIDKTKFKNYAKEIVEMLNRSLERLLYSYEKAKQFLPNKTNFTDDELEIIESMCSRFARTNDLLLQKAFRFLDIFEYNGYDFSVPQRISLAKQRGLIDDETEFKYIRELRNEVAHNYATDYFIELFNEILNYIPKLKKITITTVNYLSNKVINK